MGPSSPSHLWTPSPPPPGWGLRTQKHTKCFVFLPFDFSLNTQNSTQKKEKDSSAKRQGKPTACFFSSFFFLFFFAAAGAQKISFAFLQQRGGGREGNPRWAKKSNKGQVGGWSFWKGVGWFPMSGEGHL